MYYSYPSSLYNYNNPKKVVLVKKRRNKIRENQPTPIFFYNPNYIPYGNPNWYLNNYKIKRQNCDVNKCYDSCKCCDCFDYSNNCLNFEKNIKKMEDELKNNTYSAIDYSERKLKKCDSKCSSKCKKKEKIKFFIPNISTSTSTSTRKDIKKDTKRKSSLEIKNKESNQDIKKILGEGFKKIILNTDSDKNQMNFLIHEYVKIKTELKLTSRVENIIKNMLDSIWQ